MNSTEERYSKLRRQKINVMLNEEERRIITEKAIKYGFGDCLAEYIRAACIYENIYINIHTYECAFICIYTHMCVHLYISTVNLCPL